MRRFYLINFHYEDFYGDPLRNPPLGPAYILQHLSDNGVRTKFHEMSFNNDNDYLLKDIQMFNPDLIGCSFMTYHYKKTYKYIESLKRLGIPIVCGGVHVNSKGSKVMDELDVDFLIKGEGEKSLLSLLQNIRNPEAFPNIPGLIYRKNGRVVENGATIIDIEELRFPRYGKFDLNQYADGRILIQTSRGCPYQCTFCQQASLLGKEWRARSPQKIIQELEYWGALGKTSFVFGDDNLTLDRKRIYQLCELMKKSKYRFQIETAGVRMDNVDYETLKMMKDAGFHDLSFGVESGSDRVLREIRKGITLNQIHQALEMSCNLGFDIKLYFMINNRTETYQEAQQSFSLSRQYPISLARFTNLCPFPGTYDYEWILKHGKLLYPPEEYLNNPNHFIDQPIYDGPGMSLEERMQVIEDAKAELARFKNPITPLFLNGAENHGSTARRSVWINKDEIRKTPQRVLFVNHSVYPLEKSGTPLSTQNHALGMVKRGWDVAVLIPKAGIKRGYLKEKTADGFTLYQVPAMDKFVAYLADPYQASLSDYRQNIERIIEDFHPQIVQINDYVLMPAEIVEIFSRKGCIVIREVCNCEELCHQDNPVISDGLRGFLCSGPENPQKCARCFVGLPKTSSCSAKIGISPRSIEAKIEQRFNYIKKLYKDVVDKVVFTSEPFKAYYTRFVQIPEEKMKVIPRGFSFSDAKPMRRAKHTDALIHFAFIGNIMFSKGIDVCLKAFEKISQGHHFMLHIYGGMVNSEYHDWIDRLQVHHPGRFMYHGSYQVDELPKILSEIDVCIVPSYFDSYNRVVRETLSLGIPIIVTDFFGAYIVDNGRNGFKIPIGDAEALAARMIDFIRHPNRIEDLARGAAQTPIPSLEEEINMLIETYHELSNQVPEAKKALLNGKIKPDNRQKSSPEKSVKLIAFYLPQYHPIPENDQWWGKGFTEWTNVAKAKPLFPGHYQPHIPADLGFYDLRLPETRKAQADLAREYGFYGFCYYHYWFNGKLLLERPLYEVLKSGEPDFPFCLCWANENWTRVWDGGEDHILMEQKYSEEDDRHHIRYLCDLFRDRRYIRINGNPLFLVYRANRLPDPLRTTTLWREEARKMGIGELYLCRVESFPDERVEPGPIGFDAAVEFQPDWTNLTPELRDERVPELRAFRYEKVVEQMLRKEKPSYKRFPCVTPSWDSTPRRKEKATLLTDSSPDLYEKWLRETIQKFDTECGDERIVFINAWNEWGEGNHLEPDQKFGRGYLEATRRALKIKEVEKDEAEVTDAYKGIHQILITQGKCDEAIFALEKLLESYPDYALAHNDLGVLYYNKGDKEKAQLHYEKAVSLKPDNPTFLKNLADFYYVELGRTEDALKIEHTVLAKEPNDVEALLAFGHICSSLNRIDDALCFYENVVQIHPDHTEAKAAIEEIFKKIRSKQARGQKETPEPWVSMIIPAKGGLGSLQSRIEMLLKNTSYPKFEVILISTGLSNAIGDLIPSLGSKNIKQFTPPENIGKIAALNLAARGATGDYLVFMDPRSLPSKNWLPELLKVVFNTQNFGSVAPKVIDSFHSIIEAGFTLPDQDGIKAAGEGEAIDCPKYNYFRETPSGSPYLMLLSKEAFVESGGFDEKITDFGLAMIDLGLTLKNKGKALFYQPSSIVELKKEEDREAAGQEAILPDEKRIENLRPSIVRPEANGADVDSTSRKKIIVFGIYLANKLNNVADIVEELSTSKRFGVIQRWIALGGSPPSEKVADVTVKAIMGRKPKYEIMNELISGEDLSQYEYVLMMDDDIILPKGFVDEFITLQDELKFAIAQPARTPNSDIDHPIVEQQSGILARETLFVEIGPVVSFHRSVYDLIFPFDLTSPMGWGYENVWSYLIQERRMKMGIIDHTPVNHSLRKPVQHYDWNKADQERKEYLCKHPHLPLETCFTTLNVINYGGVK
ncbi:MAG: glycoside hydrolase family 99-like domain-containing protein [Thermodesulfobacteriota bacterium]